MTRHATILRIAVPAPLRYLLDYLPPKGCDMSKITPGMRIHVPLGKRKVVGVVMELSQHSDLPRSQLKPAEAMLDRTTMPALSKPDLDLAIFASHYYHYPIGEVLATSLPKLVRQGRPLMSETKTRWTCTPTGADADRVPSNIKRAPTQQAILQLLQQQADGMTETELRAAGVKKTALKALQEKGLINAEMETINTHAQPLQIRKGPKLNHDQQQAVTPVFNALGQFQSFLLDGVTGSGKTEVYFTIIEAVLKRDEQALVLVPEIALTPQTVARFKARFQTMIAVLHSGLTDRERFYAWLAARTNQARIIIGTRSAIFTSLPKLGVIIIDEEHDSSYKQQEGFRYSARDLAVIRAQKRKIPIILGTATPSLESLHNAVSQRYQHLLLPKRAGTARMPGFQVIDIRNQHLEHGLSSVLITNMRKHLINDAQVILFLNRRGYSPTLICHHCGWLAQCPRCDARLVLHQQKARLVCHHCEFYQALMSQCPSCQVEQLLPLGLGTERIESALQKHFPDIAMTRIDRDSTQKRGAMQAKLEAATSGAMRILIGTQMLAKGHHFPDVSLVAIIDADSGFYSADMRATERMGQLIMQIAGRAGRAKRPGEVLIQTRQPTHPLLQTLLADGYQVFSDCLLRERRQVGLPPFRHSALLRAEAFHKDEALNYLNQLKLKVRHLGKGVIALLGPVPAAIERKANRYRAQLLFQSARRSHLHAFLTRLLPVIESQKHSRRLRWYLDIDPLEMY